MDKILAEQEPLGVELVSSTEIIMEQHLKLLEEKTALLKRQTEILQKQHDVLVKIRERNEAAAIERQKEQKKEEKMQIIGFVLFATILTCMIVFKLLI